MKLSQEELFLLSQIYEKGMDKKSIIEELDSIDEEGNFLKELIDKIESLNEEDFIILLNDDILSLNFSLEDIEQ